MDKPKVNTTVKILHRTTGVILCRVDDLRSGRLREADLRGANLSEIDLSWADLRWVDLRGADLSWADLRGASLSGADLSWADLREADLRGANLSKADLRGTCLDPAAPIPPVPDAEILGLEIDGDRVYGWRTARSQWLPTYEYLPGEHVAPVFSTAPTACHPGIYLASRPWLQREYPTAAIVRCYALRADLHRAGDKWRARKIIVVVPGEPGWRE